MPPQRRGSRSRTSSVALGAGRSPLAHRCRPMRVPSSEERPRGSSRRNSVIDPKACRGGPAIAPIRVACQRPTERRRRSPSRVGDRPKRAQRAVRLCHGCVIDWREGVCAGRGLSPLTPRPRPRSCTCGGWLDLCLASVRGIMLHKAGSSTLRREGAGGGAGARVASCLPICSRRRAQG